MIYNIINSGRLKTYKIWVSILLIISCMNTLNSCMTTYNYMGIPESVLSDSTAKITKVELNNGITINCTDKIVKFETGADSLRYLVIKSYVKGSDKSVYWDERKIPEIEISGINIEKSEVNVTKTIFFVVGIATLAVVVGFIVALAISPPTFKIGGFK